jgi:hypothetical protein
MGVRATHRNRSRVMIKLLPELAMTGDARFLREGYRHSIGPLAS